MDLVKVEKINKCISRIKRGDRTRAVEELYDLIGRPIRVVANKYFSNAFDVDDAVQDFWASIVDFCQKCRYFTNGYNYLLKCFENLCRMNVRSEHRAAGRMSVSDIADYENKLVAKEGLSAEETALRASFEKAVKGLTEEERAVYVLTLYGEKTVREAAEELGFSKSKTDRIKKSVLEKIKSTLIADGWDK